MKKNTRKMLIGILFSLALIFIMVTMHQFSKENSEISNHRSEGIMELIQNKIQKPLERTPEGYYLSGKIQDVVVRYSPYGNDWNSNVRKFAHFGLYMLLAIILYFVLSMFNLKYLPRIGWTLLICFIFAFFDEYTQVFRNRTASFHDVLLDFSGAFCGMSFAVLVNMFKISIQYMIYKIEQYYQSY